MIWWAGLSACGENNTEPVKEEEIVHIDPSQQGSSIVATRADRMINRHGQELDVQYWYPTLEAREDLHVYDDIIVAGVQDRGTPDCSQERPVVMFSHGNGGMRYQSFFLTEYLASHGFVVVAPDHYGNTAFDMNAASLSELIFRRPEDIVDSFSHLLDHELFQGCIDPDAGYAIIGHSFGGYTSIALAGAQIDTEETSIFCSTSPSSWLCSGVAEFAQDHGTGVYDRQDSRIWGAVPMTPAGYEAVFANLDKIEIPMLYMGGGKDTTTGMSWSVQPLYDGVIAPKWLAEFPEAGHYTFSNACDILPAYDDCGEGFLPPPEAHLLINEIVTAFLAKELGYTGWEDSFPLESEHVLWTEN